MVDFTYNSDLTGGSLMVRESRIIADLLLKEASPEQWHEAIQVENLLQKKSQASAKRNAQAIRKRLELIEPEFWRALRDGDDEIATQVTFCAALARNLLLVEFMERVVQDAYVTHTESLDLYQWNDFLEDCAHKDPVIHDWKESSKKKMGQVVFRILAEMGYINNTRSLKLQTVLIRPEIKIMLEDTYKQRIKDCLDVSTKGGR
tara:strand:+ start:1224 stop:1835 length:612 start_codon:yes stop_codon:yes gene_type:complete